MKEGKENALTFTKKCPAFILFIFRGFGDFSVPAQRLPKITYTVRDKWWIFDPLGICQGKWHLGKIDLSSRKG